VNAVNMKIGSHVHCSNTDVMSYSSFMWFTQDGLALMFIAVTLKSCLIKVSQSYPDGLALMFIAVILTSCPMKVEPIHLG
jgi:hypothetical protein